MEKIFYKKKLQAIIVRNKNYKGKKGIHFFTERSLPLQVAYMSHPKDHIIQPHIHRKIIRKISIISEAIIILKGVILVYFLNKKKKIFKKKKISKGDVVLFIKGGHGFKVLKKSKFFEIKQGPYNGKKLDKIILNEFQ